MTTLVAPETINALALRYQRGDHEALPELYEALHLTIFKAIGHITALRLPACLSADDVRQQSWIVLAELALRWEPSGSFLGYVLASLDRRLRQWAARASGRSFSPGAPHDVSVPHDEFMLKLARYAPRESAPEQAAIVADYLAVLPESERAALVLLAFEDLRFEDIGARIGVSRATARRLCVRAGQALKASMCEALPSAIRIQGDCARSIIAAWLISVL